MQEKVQLSDKLIAAILPTAGQAAISFALAGVMLMATHAKGLMSAIGAPQAVVDAAGAEFQSALKMILGSQIASNAALIAFWATVGLIVYLLSWSAYNVLVQARNEVTLNTAYTNRGHWHSPFATLGLKVASAFALVATLALLSPGFHLWFGLFDDFLAQLSPSSAALMIASVVGIAAQLYLVFAAAVLTFTPWYRAETFTDSAT